METSNHWPCIIEINTKIPKGHIFRFENHWLDRDDFATTVVRGWSAPYLPNDSAKALTTKCKNLRKVLKDWNARTPPLSKLIENAKLILQFLDSIKCFRDLSLIEWNFREIFKFKAGLLTQTTEKILEAKGQN